VYDRVVARTHARTHQQTKNNWKILKIIHWSKIKSSFWIFWVRFLSVIPLNQ